MLPLLLDLAPPGWTATLPPEIQHSLGIAAAITLAAGFLSWAAGVKIARLVVALSLALAAALASLYFLPKFIDLSPITTAILGLVPGFLLGLFAFRLVQGLTLALVLSLAVSALYYQWHIPHLHAAPASTQAADLLPRSDLFPAAPATNPAKPALNFTTILKSLGDHLNAIPPQHLKRLLIAGLGTAALALLLAFEFPRFTTWIITAILGSLLILLSAHILVALYLPDCESWFPTSPIPRYALLTGLILLGLLIQYRFFPPPTDTSRKQTKPQSA